MSLYEKIRRAAGADPPPSIRSLSREFRVHRRDVRQALASAVPPPRRAVPERPAPVLDPWKPLIRRWLQEDQSAPRKQRHTARRVHQRLVAEHGAQVGESTVRRFVASVRSEQEFPLVEVAVPQTHPLGEEAECDFGESRVILAGGATDVQIFLMRLSASGKGFAWAYLCESQEAFLDGHIRAFEFFGGVPGRVRYDNLKAAVSKVLRGRDRAESERFVALRSHYRFDSFFCLPGIKGAHEKGGVEGEVGRFRRRHLVPVPKVDSMDELNELLIAGCAKDDSRHIAARGLTVGEHYSLEVDALGSLPAEAFDYRAVASHRVDRKARVSVRGATYSVPARYAGRRLDVRVGAETVEVFAGAGIVARHTRSPKGEENLVLDHYLEVLAHKPGALPGSTALARARAAGVFSQTHENYWTQARRRLGDRDGTRVLIEVLLLHRTTEAGAVTAAMTAALAAGSVDPAVVAIEARRQTEPDLAVPAPIGAGLSRFNRPKPSIADYDQLLEATP